METKWKDVKSKRTKGDWMVSLTPTGKKKIIDSNGFSIANLSATVEYENEANAQFICVAANNHERLVKALLDIISTYETEGGFDYDEMLIKISTGKQLLQAIDRTTLPSLTNK